jgi:translocation and assembly module TamB
MSAKKKLRIALVSLPLCLILLAGAVALFVQTRTFNRYVLVRLISNIERSAGVRLEVQSLKLTWSPFSAELFGIVAHGKEAPDEMPFFRAKRLAVSLGLRALLRREVNLYSVTLDEPIVNARIDAAGNSNFPNVQPSSSSNFSMVIRHAFLRNGVVRFNDQQIPLTAEIDDLTVRINYDSPSGMYRGDAAYRNGQLATPSVHRMPHSARMQFAVNRNLLELEQLEVRTQRSQFELAARMRDPANPHVEGHYRGRIDMVDVANTLKAASLPHGEIAVSGDLSYASERGASFLRGLQIEGRLDSPELAVHRQGVFVPVRNVHAVYRVREGDLTVERLDANVFNGRLSGKVMLTDLDGAPSGKLIANLRNVSLQTISNAFPANARQNAHLLGDMNVDGHAQWKKDTSTLRAQLHADISGPDNLSPGTTRALPVNGVVDLTYDGAAQRASFGDSQLRVAQTVLRLKGEVSRTSHLNVDLTAPDLQELSVLTSAFAESASSSQPAKLQETTSAPPYDLRGAAHFSGQVTGTIQDPNLKGQLSATNLQVQGSSWRSLGVSVSARSTGLQLHKGNLEGARQGKIMFESEVGLNRWSYAPGNPIALNATFTNISADDLERLARVHYPVTGTLSGNIAISGSQLAPVGHGSLQLAKGSAWNEPIRTLKVDFQGNSGTVQSNADLQLAAGTAKASLFYDPKNRRYKLKLDVPGLRLEQLQNVQQLSGNPTGLLTASVTGEGELSDPQLSATLEIPELQIAGQRFSGSRAQIDVAQQRANINVDSIVEQGFVRAKGTLELRDQYQTNAAIDLRALPIGPLLASHSTQTGIAQDLEGYMEVRVSIAGPLKDPARLEGRMEIPRLNFAYKGIEIANDAPLRVRYRNGIATIEQARMRGTGTDVSLQGVVPIEAAVPLNASAKGEIDAKLLQLLSPDVHSSGKVEFDLRAGGGLRSPETQGTIRIMNTGLAVEGAPLTIGNMNGQLSIAGNRLQIDRLEATAGGGTLSANGSATYGKETNLALDLHAKGVRALANGIRSTLNGDLQLNGTPQKSELKGQVVVDRLSFREGFDLSTFVSQFSESTTVSSPSPIASNMQLAISVQSSESLSLASSQVSLAGGANLTVAGTADKPVLLGRINLTNGELFFQNKRLEIQNGTIVFSNPARTEPVVNLYVKTVVQQYNITINFAGPLDRLKTTYTSDPSLPPLDIINLLAFGQTTGERASNASTPASLGAESAIAKGVAGQVAKGVQNLTGVSQLTIDPTVSASQDPGAQVAIQQRVTGSILMTFSTDVTSTQRQTVQLQYQPKPQWKISVLRDASGGYGIDVRLHKVF